MPFSLVTDFAKIFRLNLGRVVFLWHGQLSVF